MHDMKRQSSDELSAGSGVSASQNAMREHELYSLNDATPSYPYDDLIHELFEEQVRRAPDAVAIVHNTEVVTYAELNRRANQLARYLRKQGVGPDQLVGICVERSVEMIVGLIGILKAGGAYVPLDPTYPATRLQFMLQDAAPRLVLTQESLRAVVPDTREQVVALDAKVTEISTYPDGNLARAEVGLSPRNLVYVIYTSGSTGTPKGTAMAHYSMVNLVEWHRRNFSNEGRRVAQFAALSFDVAFQETFSTLCTGGTLVLLDEWIRRDARALAEFLGTQSIQRLFMPPLMLQSLAEYFRGASTIALPALEDVITAGEQLRISAEISSFFKRLERCRLHNHYGPTETHVVTALSLTGDPGEWPALPSIGQPISNAQIHILDAEGEPVPRGEIGEIYIGGVAVARGYWNRAELTEQRFIADSFAADPNRRLYRTGDLGRWRPDGTVEYLGRNDDQVKIRGYRIELGEIEAQLARHAQVKEAAVVARENAGGERRLVAYVTARDPQALSAEVLRSQVKGALPEYMIPSAFVIMESFPVTPNGKLDRRALPEPEQQAYASREYDAPRGEIEGILAQVWQELLGVERIGRQDDFFELGGHSLLIVQMMERLQRVGLSVDVVTVFERPTLADLAAALASGGVQFEPPPNLIPPGCEALRPQMLPLVELERHHIEIIERAVPGGAANIQDIYPLAALQEGVLFHNRLHQQSGDIYVVPMLLSLSSQQKLEECIQALQHVIDRHDSLRTAVLWEDLPHPVQVVYRRATLQVEHLSLDPDRDALEQLRERMSPEHQHLDLRRAPLVRVNVAVDVRSGKPYALVQLHHLTCDHEAHETLLEEVGAFVEGRAHELPEPMPYRNHVAQVLEHAKTHDAEAFFREKLGGIDEPTAPFALLDVRGDATRIVRDRQTLDAALAERVRACARELGVTAATLFHAAWALVVACTSGRDDVVYGTVLLGRMHGSSVTQRMLGMFINTLPLRLRLNDVTTGEFVEQVQRELVELLAHEQASLAVAQRCSDIPRSAPLFSTLLNYLYSSVHFETEQTSVTSGIEVLATHEWTNYPVTLSVADQGNGFVLTAQTDHSIDPRRMTEYMHTALGSLVEALQYEPSRLVISLPVMSERERHQIVTAFNPRPGSYPKEALDELFEQQAQRTPDAAAVALEMESLSFAELNRKANRLARYLRTKNVGPDDLVGVCVERSLDMVVCLLGILKAGGAYLPLDPDYPSQRLAHILEDAQPKVVLTQDRIRTRLPPTAAAIVSLGGDGKLIAQQDASNLDSTARTVHPHHLAYVIYTSGSTGLPKGVMVEHHNVVSLWHSLENIYRQSPDCQRIGVNASLNFDASVKQLVQVLSGRTLVVIPQEIRWDAAALLSFIARNRIQGIDCTPSQLKVWISAGLLDDHRCPLRVVLVGGEPIDPELWSTLAQCSRIDFYNVYGPTESTVDATAVRLRDDTARPHIGRPIENRRVYIVNRHGDPAPIGVVGEICIGGAGVARGYLKRPELTAERFVPDPFCDDRQGRMYKTGDLGSWRADGTIEYVGRNDHQVKIRGFRVELGEIEAQLVLHDEVNEAAVFIREDDGGEARLVAYVTRPEGACPSVESLRAHLQLVLPDHMVPSAFVVMDRFPLSASGKLDRRALPAPDSDAYSSERYESPQGEVEEVLAKIWEDLLRVERVGRNDNFFDLGGHSLLGMQVMVRIRSLLSVEMPMSSLFDFPVLKQMAAQVDALRRAELLDSIASGDDEVDELLQKLTEMPEGEVQQLISELRSGRAR